MGWSGIFGLAFEKLYINQLRLYSEAYTKPNAVRGKNNDDIIRAMSSSTWILDM